MVKAHNSTVRKLIVGTYCIYVYTSLVKYVNSFINSNMPPQPLPTSSSAPISLLLSLIALLCYLSTLLVHTVMRSLIFLSVSNSI